MQCCTNLVPVLDSDARVHVAIVAVHIPLLGIPSCPQTSSVTCYGVGNWGG